MNGPAPCSAVSHSTSMRRSGSYIRFITLAQAAECTDTPLPRRDVADDLLAANRIAAARAHDQQIVDPLDLDAVRARPQDALDHRRQAGFRRLLLQRVLSDDLAQDELRRHLPVAHRRVEIVELRIAVLLPDLGQRVVAQTASRRRRSASPPSRRSSDRARCCAPSPRLERSAGSSACARDVCTKPSQSRLGLCPTAVMISTMSPFLRRLRSGTMLPFTRAPTHWWPMSV